MKKSLSVFLNGMCHSEQLRRASLPYCSTLVPSLWNFHFNKLIQLIQQATAYADDFTGSFNKRDISERSISESTCTTLNIMKLCQVLTWPWRKSDIDNKSPTGREEISKFCVDELSGRKKCTQNKYTWCLCGRKTRFCQPRERSRRMCELKTPFNTTDIKFIRPPWMRQSEYITNLASIEKLPIDLEQLFKPKSYPTQGHTASCKTRFR